MTTKRSELVGLLRTCSYQKPDGKPCRAAPLRDQGRCFWHSRTTAKEAAEARRLGGLRRRREGTVSGAYDLEALESVPQIRRLLAIATVDALSLDNSIARVRALIALALAGAKLLEVGELEERVTALEQQQAVLDLQPGGWSGVPQRPRDGRR